MDSPYSYPTVMESRKEKKHIKHIHTHTHTHMRVVLLAVTPMDFTQPAPFFAPIFVGDFRWISNGPRFRKKEIPGQGRSRSLDVPVPVGSVGR